MTTCDPVSNVLLKASWQPNLNSYGPTVGSNLGKTLHKQELEKPLAWATAATLHTCAMP